MKVYVKKKQFWLIACIVIALTLVCSIMLLFLPVNHQSTDTTKEIISEMTKRIEAVSEKREKINFVSFTPFMWDEGYFIDNTMDEEALKAMSDRRIQYKELAEGEQRLVFYYEGQQTADFVIGKDDINFDISPGEININDGWLNIDVEEKGIRLYR